MQIYFQQIVLKKEIIFYLRPIVSTKEETVSIIIGLVNYAYIYRVLIFMKRTKPVVLCRFNIFQKSNFKNFLHGDTPWLLAISNDTES